MNSALHQFGERLGEWLPTCMEEYSKIIDENDSEDAAHQALCGYWLDLLDGNEMSDSLVVQLLADHVQQNVETWLTESMVAHEEIHQVGSLMLGWVQLVCNVLHAPDDEESLTSLMDLLMDDCWAVPLSDESLEALVMTLASEAVETEETVEAEETEVPNEKNPCDTVTVNNDKTAALDAVAASAVDEKESDIDVDSWTSDDDHETLDAFKEEMAILLDDIGSAQELLTMPDASHSLFFKIRDAWDEANQLATQMAEMLGFDTLEAACLGFGAHLSTMDPESMDEAMQWAERVDAWMMLFKSTLEGTVDVASCAADDLVEFVCDESLWQIEKDAGSTKVITEQACDADVSLRPETDVHPELLQAFFQESEDHAANFSAAIQRMYAGQCEQELLATTQRVAHTLKGAANTTGFRGIATLTHRAEDLLEYLYQHKLTPPQALLTVLMDVADCLEVMVEHIQGRADAPADAIQVLQQLMNWHALMKSGELRNNPDAVAAAPELAPPAKVASEGIAETTEVVHAEADSEQVMAESLRVPMTLVDSLMRDVGEITILMGQMRKQFSSLIDQAHGLAAQEFSAYQYGIELDVLMSARGMALVRGTHDATPASTKKDSHSGFDPLEMDQYNELHSGLSRLLESVSDSRSMAGSMQTSLEGMDAMLHQHNRLHGELQDNILQTRMTPFVNMEMRLQRVVRQTTRKTGKRADLLCSGMELMMDTDVLNKLADPLMHILRNAVDHGIESTEDRIAKGKPESGLIHLNVSHLGADILITCIDDGRGLDYDAIKATAIKKGMLSEAQEATNDELARMTMLPGFTTREKATQVSGRGFGMDIVFQAIAQVKGRVELSAAPNGGLQVSLHLPITLMTVHSILVESQKQRYALPSRDVLRVLNIGDGVLQRLGEENGFAFEGKVYPLHDLAALLWGQQEHITAEFFARHTPLIVRADAGEHVVLVEHIHACHELIVKSMGRYVPHVHGISGGSILNDSSIASVLDVAEILRQTNRKAARTRHIVAEESRYAEDEAKEVTVMIVDDSLSVRRTLSRLMQDEGYRTVLAIDGVEAISKIEQEIPDIMLLDLELPRMNGLELAAYLRRQESTLKLPIIMITSRATQKHRDRAKQAGVNHYLIKPYQEDDVLESIERLLGTGN
ncbi:MAG: response regulator [Mariprofundaceae bacterium]|nr:response regulator [Mariprofundaceae bacterium]